MAANTLVVIILQFINVSNQHFVHFKLTQCYVLALSVMLEKRTEESLTGFYRQVSAVRNIHAGMVNCMGKSTKKSSSGPSMSEGSQRSPDAGGNWTSGGTLSHFRWEVWNPLPG